jgi:two-component system sensor histidine kinase PilS (NtrC family)
VDEAAALRRKLLWLIGLRAGVVTLLFVSAILARVGGIGLALPVDPFFTLAAVTYALTLVYLPVLAWAPERRWIVDLQLAMDALLVSAIVLVTGGVESTFSTLYVLPVLAGGVVGFRRGGLLAALLSGALYAALVTAQYTGALGLVGPADLVLPAGTLPARRLALFTVGLNAFGFVAVGLLTGYLAESLRRAGERLERASSQIADLRALSQHVIDSLTGGLATSDPAGRVLTFNRAAERIVGLPARAARGLMVWDLLQLPDLRASLGEAGTDPAGERREYVLTRPGGGRLDIGLTLAPLVTSAGRAGWVFTFQDLTEAKRRERDAQRQERLAAVGEMAAGLAHEIRNPLASITGSIQILRQELTLSDEQAQLMDIVLRESQRLNATIRDFLTYARPRAPIASRFDVGHLLRETVVLLRNSPDVGPDLRADVEVAPADLWFEADESQVRQVVWNLATNAVRAMPDGGRLRVRARVVEQDTRPGLLLSVCDEGVGIPAAEIDQVFHPFRTGFAQGTGLGLAIVHRIVTDHGGDVSVSSRPGRGTDVRVFLPRHDAAGVPRIAAPVAEPQAEVA